ncbi:Retrotransposon gag domain [Sesbania bispinosa]|nr:Retrotransposon gag domain [Sesbania bispinosa]
MKRQELHHKFFFIWYQSSVWAITTIMAEEDNKNIDKTKEDVAGEVVARKTISPYDIIDLWTNIKERFSIANGPRIQQLKAELAECKQKGMTIAAYYGRMKKLWEELANHEQLPT